MKALPLHFDSEVTIPTLLGTLFLCITGGDDGISGEAEPIPDDSWSSENLCVGNAVPERRRRFLITLEVGEGLSPGYSSSKLTGDPFRGNDLLNWACPAGDISKIVVIAARGPTAPAGNTPREALRFLGVLGSLTWEAGTVLGVGPGFGVKCTLRTLERVTLGIVELLRRERQSCITKNNHDKSEEHTWETTKGVNLKRWSR